MAVATQIAVTLSISTIFAVCLFASLPPAKRVKVLAAPCGFWDWTRKPSASTSDVLRISQITAEDVLLSQLQHANAETAGPLHVALAQVYNADGRPTQALQHYEKAVRAALRSGHKDRIVEASVSLGEAYLRVGRSKDAERELVEAAHLIDTSHFDGDYQGLALDQALGHARRDLGQLDSAMGLYKRAMNRPVPRAAEDMASLLSDIAEIHQYRGQNAESLTYLQKAQKQLQAREGLVPSMNVAPATARAQLEPEIHRRIGVASHGLGDFLKATSHFKIALHLEQRLLHPRSSELSLIVAGLAKAEEKTRVSDKGDPKLQGPVLTQESAVSQPGGVIASKDLDVSVSTASKHKSDAVAPQHESNKQNVGRLEDAKGLRDAGKLQEAEALAENLAEAGIRSAGGIKGADVAASMNVLGSIHRLQERFPQASQAYLSALQAALALPRDGGGIGGSEAQDAYLGISYIMPRLHYLGQPSDAEALLKKAIVIADDAGVPKNNSERESYESRLQANAINPVHRVPRPASSSVAGSQGKEVPRDKHPAKTKKAPKDGRDSKAWWRGESQKSDPKTSSPAGASGSDTAARQWWRGKSREKTDSASTKPSLPAGAPSQQAGTLRGRGATESAEALLQKGRLDEAEVAAGQEADARVREAGGIKGADVASAMNLLGAIRRQGQRFPEASEAYLSALTAALATPRDGGGIGGKQAETAYLGISYIMPMLIFSARDDEAKKLLAQAVAIADAAGVPTNADERKRFEARLRANAIDPVHRIQPSPVKQSPPQTRPPPLSASRGQARATKNEVSDSASLNEADSGVSSIQVGVARGPNAQIVGDIHEDFEGWLGKWFRDPNSPEEIAMRVEEERRRTSINISPIDDDQLFASV